MASIAPIHPEGVLLEDIQPLRSPSTTWLSPLAYPRAESTRSSTASATRYDLEIEKHHLGPSVEEIHPLRSA